MPSIGLRNSRVTPLSDESAVPLGNSETTEVMLRHRTELRVLMRELHARHGESTTIRVLDSGSMSPLMRGEYVAEVRWGIPSNSIGKLLLLDLPGEDLTVHRAIDHRSGAVLQAADKYFPGFLYAAGWVPTSRILGTVEALVDERGRRIDLTGGRANWVGRSIAAVERALWRADMGGAAKATVWGIFAGQRVVVRIGSILLVSRRGRTSIRSGARPTVG